MTALALIFTLSAIGISETVYLVRKRVASEKPVCPIGGGCEAVLASQYNKFFLVHNDVLGLLTYVVICSATALLVIGVQPTFILSSFVKVLVGVASVASLIFTYLQWKVVRAWCFWCLMSAFTIWLMEIIILASGSL